MQCLQKKIGFPSQLACSDVLEGENVGEAILCGHTHKRTEITPTDCRQKVSRSQKLFLKMLKLFYHASINEIFSTEVQQQSIH